MFLRRGGTDVVTYKNNAVFMVASRLKGLVLVLSAPLLNQFPFYGLGKQ